MSAALIADKLRASLLQAAIQGKLTKQLAEDGDARDLLKDIEAEKARLIEEKVIKKEKPLPPITDDEIPFEIPDNWTWVRLGDISNKITDGSHNPPKNSGVGYPIISAKNIKNKAVDFSLSDRFVTEEDFIKEDKRTNIRKGDVLLTIVGSIGEACVVETDELFTAQRSVSVIKTQIFPYYLMFVFFSPLFKSFAQQKASGTAQQGIYLNTIKNFSIPLPPLAEQYRIVEAIETALAKLDKLKSDENKLYDIQKAFPNKLRASLLQSAIQGQLTKQLPEDGNACDLLKEIEAEKARLIEEKIIKKEKPLPPITDEEIPFEIPENWAWVRLGDVASYIQRGKSPKYSLIQKYPVISQKCVQWSGFDISVAKFIEPKSLESYAEERLLQNNDLLWNSTGTGTVGRISRYQTQLNPYGFAVADSHVSVIRFYSELMNPLYIELFITSAHIQQDIENMCSGTTKQKELNLSTIKLLLIPLPSLAEQQRIVEKLDEILGKVDGLRKIAE